MLLLWIVVFFYSVLSLPVRVVVRAGISGARGSTALCILLPGICLRADGMIEAHGLIPAYAPRYGGNNQKRKAPQRIRTQARAAKLLLQGIDDKDIRLYARVGTGDAASTALAAGTLSAVLPMLLEKAAGISPRALRIEPEFSKTCLLAAGQIVFSGRLGDMAVSLIRAASSAHAAKAPHFPTIRKKHRQSGAAKSQSREAMRSAT